MNDQASQDEPLSRQTLADHLFATFTQARKYIERDNNEKKPWSQIWAMVFPSDTLGAERAFEVVHVLNVSLDRLKGQVEASSITDRLKKRILSVVSDLKVCVSPEAFGQPTSQTRGRLVQDRLTLLEFAADGLVNEFPPTAMTKGRLDELTACVDQLEQTLSMFPPNSPVRTILGPHVLNLKWQLMHFQFFGAEAISKAWLATMQEARPYVPRDEGETSVSPGLGARVWGPLNRGLTVLTSVANAGHKVAYIVESVVKLIGGSKTPPSPL